MLKKNNEEAEETGRGRPNQVDVHVGKKLRQRRTLIGMSQERLGDALGLTFQQVQKYERGINRIGSSRLYELCQVLDVPVNYFFDGLPGLANTGEAPTVNLREDQADYDADPMTRRETLELVRAYYRIQDPTQRRKLFELARALAGGK